MDVIKENYFIVEKNSIEHAYFIEENCVNSDNFITFVIKTQFMIINNDFLMDNINILILYLYYIYIYIVKTHKINLYTSLPYTWLFVYASTIDY